MTRPSEEEIQVLVYGCPTLRVNVFSSLFVVRRTLGHPSVFGMMLLVKTLSSFCVWHDAFS
jgi:hypothetical protein